MNTRHWLLWDGDCGVCRKLTLHLERHDSRHRFTILPYQEAPSPPMTPALRIQSAKALQVVTRDGHRFSGGRAVLFAMYQTGWYPRLAQFLSHRPLIWGVDAAYWVVARYRRYLNRFIPEP
jgi:predicted DCC family thiol-disulfide oxidoreductase YuxK